MRTRTYKPLEQIEAWEIAGPLKLRARFADGAELTTDMSGLARSSRLFATLADEEVFRGAKLIHGGTGIEWPNGLDYSAGALRMLAEAQRGLTGADFAAWMKRMKLSINDAADVMGVDRATIMRWRRREGRVPHMAALAARAIEEQPTLMFAHLRMRKPGRPTGWRKGAAVKAARASMALGAGSRGKSSNALEKPTGEIGRIYSRVTVRSHGVRKSAPKKTA